MQVIITKFAIDNIGYVWIYFTDRTFWYLTTLEELEKWVGIVKGLHLDLES